MEETGKKRQRRRTYLPLEQRIRLYNEVIQLREQGLSYKDIIERICRSDGVRLYASRIHYWVHGLQKPLGNVNKFDAKRSPELASVIGTLLSDGNRQLHGDHEYGLWLGVKDRDFAEAFGRDLAKVLGKEKPYRPHWSKRRWIVEGYSIMLFKHLDKPWQELKPYIEANKTCVARFLGRFFDGEASIAGRTLTVSNTNKKLLLYIQRLLLRYFGIKTTGPHRGAKAGHYFRDSKNDRTYESKKQCYYLRIRTQSLRLFYKHIGFTIRRKQRRLIEAIHE